MLAGWCSSRARRSGTRPGSTRKSRIRKRLHELAKKHPGSGYRRMSRLLRREGMKINRKRVQRLWREEGLRTRCGSGESAPAGTARIAAQ
jgi:putative transposase